VPLNGKLSFKLRASSFSWKCHQLPESDSFEMGSLDYSQEVAKLELDYSPASAPMVAVGSKSKRRSRPAG
jgi:hypothetical protein